MINRWGIPLLLVGISFVFLNYFDFPYETPKLLFFRILLSVLFWWLGIKIILAHKIHFPRWSKYFSWVFLFIILANIFSFVFSIDIGRSFFGSEFRYQGFYTFIHYIFLTCFVFLTFQKDDWKIYEKTLAFINLGLFFISFWQFFIAKDMYFFGRVDATLGQPVYLAQLLILFIPLFLSAWIKNSNKVFWGIITVTAIFTLLLTISRGATIGFLVGMIFFAIVFAWKYRIRWLSRFCIVGVSVVFGLFIFLNIFAEKAWIQNSLILQRFTFVQETSVRSVLTRFEIWKGTIPLIADHAIFGVGQDTFDIAFQTYQSGNLKKYPDAFADRAHNIILDLLATYGVFGFLAYAGFFCVLIIYGFRFIKKEEKKEIVLPVLGFLSGFISLFVALQFNFFVTIHHVFFWAFAAIFLVFFSKEKQTIQWKMPEWMQYSLITLLTVGLGVNILFFNLF